MDKIETVLEKRTDMHDFLCHAKKWNMTKKCVGGTFNYSAGDGSAERKCFNCEQLECEVSKYKKPLNRDVIKKNCEKYSTTENKQGGGGKKSEGDGNRERDKGRDNNTKKNDANPVDS